MDAPKDAPPTFVPPLEAQPLGAIGECLRSSFEAACHASWAAEITVLMIQLSHVPYPPAED